MLLFEKIAAARKASSCVVVVNQGVCKASDPIKASSEREASPSILDAPLFRAGALDALRSVPSRGRYLERVPGGASRRPILAPARTTKGSPMPKGREAFPVQSGMWEATAAAEYENGLLHGRFLASVWERQRVVVDVGAILSHCERNRSRLDKTIDTETKDRTIRNLDRCCAPPGVPTCGATFDWLSWQFDTAALREMEIQRDLRAASIKAIVQARQGDGYTKY